MTKTLKLKHEELPYSLDVAIERAARDLPPGWVITISIENGSAWVDIIDTIGCDNQDIDMDGSIAEKVEYALLMATGDIKP